MLLCILIIDDGFGLALLVCICTLFSFSNGLIAPFCSATHAGVLSLTVSNKYFCQDTPDFSLLVRETGLGGLFGIVLHCRMGSGMITRVVYRQLTRG